MIWAVLLIGHRSLSRFQRLFNDQIRNLKAGDKLPTEKQMCVALGISRPPLREDLKL